MKALIAIALAAGVTVAAAESASAAQGCGPGFHRGPYGRCIPNRGPGGPIVAAPGGLIVGNFYQGRGYWDGRRYYPHRERHGGGWRYR
jgi:hypothetical protein